MMLTAEEISSAIGARASNVPPDLAPNGYSIDSRTLNPGECFVAIAGPNFDGHQFIPDALRKGAAAVIANSKSDYPLEPRWPVFFVDNTLIALQRLARYLRRKWGGITIAITGSTGKTTAKEIMATLLESRYRVFKSLGNFNNDYGLPLSILKLNEGYNLAVLEMGMSHAGELSRLCEIAEPNIGVVTNVRPVHLENFRSISGIAQAKRELVESLPADGMAVLNNDDVRVRRFGKSFAGRVITFGVEAAATYKASERKSLGLDGSEFRLDYKSRGHLLKVPLIGDHNIYNCLPGIAVAHQLGLRFEVINQSLQKLKPVAGRGVVSHFREGFSVVNDSYNSNPAALKAMIVFLARAQGYQRKILVAGEMLELGEKSQQFHRDCGKLAASEKLNLIVGIQGEARSLCSAAKAQKGSVVETLFFENSIDAGEWLSQQVKSGDLVVVKGSRGVRTERVVEAIEKNHVTL